MCAVAKTFPVSGILLDIHGMVYAVAEPNSRGAKIVVPTRLNIRDRANWTKFRKKHIDSDQNDLRKTINISDAETA